MLNRKHQGQRLNRVIETVLYFFVALLSLGSIGCTQNSKPSFIIIAADQLSFSDANCSRDWPETNSGIGILCNESVRWAHTYTTSVLSGPALGSLLTGLYPLDTGYHHNAQFLSPEFLTLAEAAHMKRYRTAFFSGGPPILKKAGLGAGFETYDDSINLTESPWLKPFKKNVQSFLDWANDVGDRPYFAVFYVPDLRFLDRTTVNPSGDFRNRSYESQLEEFDSTLFELIQKLKKSSRWDQTHFLLLGLQGRNLYDREVLNPNMNLHSESTQVAFLWKPVQKNKRETTVSWTMDRNISLADIGHSLFELLGFPTPKSKLPTASLVLSLKKPESSFKSGRIHLIESAWADWQMNKGTQYALLLDEELYFFEKAPRLYRTLSDRLERNPIHLGSGAPDTFLLFENAAHELGITPSPRIENNNTNVWSFRYSDWISPHLIQLKQAFATTRWKDVPLDVRPWLARSLLETSDWKSLKAAGEAWKSPRLQWLAHKNLFLPDIKTDPCLRLVSIQSISGEQSKKCSDVVFLETLNALEDEGKTRRWEKILEEKIVLSSILRMNRALGSIWDIPENFDNVLSLSEMIFWTPERRPLLKSIEKKLKLIEFEPAQPERL